MSFRSSVPGARDQEQTHDFITPESLSSGVLSSGCGLVLKPPLGPHSQVTLVLVAHGSFVEGCCFNTI